MRRQIFLFCGILSPLLYALADLLAGLQWPGYSFRDQTISELGAIGAPTRMLFSTMLVAVYALLVAFGVGVRLSSGHRHKLRLAGGLLAGLGVMALTVGLFVPMRPRGIEQGLTGALHLIEGGLAMLVTLAAIGLAATTLGKHFRFYSLTTIVVVLVFGAWSGFDAPQIEAGLATPWVGVKERIFWYTYQLWFLVLAVMLLKQRPETLEAHR